MRRGHPERGGGFTSDRIPERGTPSAQDDGLRRRQSALLGSRMLLQAGDQAPDFALPDQNGREARLADFLAAKNVVLVFYVLAKTPT